MPSPYTWTPIIVSHTVFAVTSLMLGALLLRGRKGHRAHRIMGWIWVGCMASVALISFAIVGPKGFSWIHGLSVFTLGALDYGAIHSAAWKIDWQSNLERFGFDLKRLFLSPSSQ
jgi:uncharacterized membrane protein